MLAQEAGEAVEPASEDVLAQAETAALEPGLRVVSGSSLPADEGEGEAIFTLSLSAPDSKPIVVLYSALEQEAKGGVDYRVSAGVAIFEAGEVSINISVPVIDDDLGEPNEAFKLFLTVDPDMAALKDREIVTVILDND
ncbi:MAG: hypothetical protein HC871_11455 [Rhizobiales bacterium]|nr:hypothetical protein [Hyphomicrobiales bacterium]